MSKHKNQCDCTQLRYVHFLLFISHNRSNGYDISFSKVVKISFHLQLSITTLQHQWNPKMINLFVTSLCILIGLLEPASFFFFVYIIVYYYIQIVVVTGELIF